MKHLAFSLLALSFYSSLAFSAAGESSFTPESILIPIRGIYVSTEGDATTEIVYSCDTDCLIDITDDAALERLTTNTEIAVGTYTKVSIGTCKEEGSYTSNIRGSVVLSGTTYYTSSGAEPLTTADNNEYVTLEHSGCSNDFMLPQPLVISDGGETDKEGEALGSTANLSLFLALPNIAWGRLSGTATIPGGCKAGATTSVCLAYPDVVPFVGEVAPTLEIYHIADGAGAEPTAAGQLQCLFTPAGEFIGGFARRLFSETSTSIQAGFDTAFSTHEIKENGNLVIADYGSSADSVQVRFPNFARSDHTGTYTYYNPGESTQTYSAYRQ